MYEDITNVKSKNQKNKVQKFGRKYKKILKL